MRPPKSNAWLFLLGAVICLLVTTLSPAQEAVGEKTRKSTAAQDDDILRINAELVQTDVTVLDRAGRFVYGLRPEQFELSVEGKPQAISFFEQVVAIKPAGNGQTAVSKSRTASTPAAPTTPSSSGGGRTIFFFVDDVHLSPENLSRARKSLLQFIDNEMGQNDRAAIVSTSGQIGFLQQLTDSRAVLREAAARLGNRRDPETFAGKVKISEYEAAQVAEHFNEELFTYLVAATAAEYQTDMTTAANMVRNRVHQIGAQSRAVTINTLGALLGLMRSSAPLPGRKVVFFITDGFVADPRASNILDVLRRVTKTAAQVGAVIYTMDARGTFADPATDAARNDYPDFTGSVSRNLLAESSATQEPLKILASDTGGRAFLNSNSFGDGFARALDESSNYYLLAWRPERVDKGWDGKARVVVTVKGRQDLKVRVRRGFVEAPAPPALKRTPSGSGAKETNPSPEAELRAALGSLYPLRALPVSLSVGYVYAPKGGATLTASMQIDSAALAPGPSGDLGKTEVDVLGAAIDDRGALYSFRQKLMVDRDAVSPESKAVVWNQQLPLAPGLYQVRVAVRERVGGRVGTAMQWIEVPDLMSGRLGMSSLFLGERKPEKSGEKSASAPRAVMVSVDHRFSRSSVLRFQTYVYNAAASGAAAPDVEIRARVLSNDAAVVALPQARAAVDATNDPPRLPYWSEIALDQLPPGRYVLEVTATDRATKATVSQQSGFIVE